MNRLLNIGRAGGYPLCAETIAIIEHNARMIECFLGSIGIAKRTAIIFTGNTIYDTEMRGYVYYRSGNSTFGLAKLDNSLMSIAQLRSNGKLEIATTRYDVTKSDGAVVQDVYCTESAHITAASSAAEKWTFYDIRDVIQFSEYADLLPVFTTSLTSAEITSSFIALPTLAAGRTHTLKKNAKDLCVNLALSVHYRGQYNTVVKFKLSNYLGDYTPINAAIKIADTGIMYPLIAYINEGYIVCEVGRYIEDNGIFTQNNPNAWSERDEVIYINDCIVL